ncbi:MAG: hypothetical protein HZA93_23800 [Verrucomicrobia bacterium]|nr:hypothetical protein [Verrucomicrobiota bacterium]
MTTLHIDLLVALRSARDIGLTFGLLLTDLRKGRHPRLDEPRLERALRDLADKRLAAYEEAELVTRWRLTARGESALQEAGL